MVSCLALLPFFIWAGALSAAEQQSPREAERETSFRVYLVQKDDTLRSIAAQPGVYNDPLKWTLIYATNREDLQRLKVPPQEIPTKPLDSGTVLAIMTPGKAGKRQKPAGKWVVNLLSSQNEANLVPLSIRMIDSGYFTYISRGDGLKADWLRLRTGFFSDEAVAKAAGSKVLTEMELSEFWVIEADEAECAAYHGFTD